MPITEDNLLRYFNREWFPKTIFELEHDFDTSLAVLFTPLHKLCRADKIRVRWSGQRHAFVYSVPHNPNLPRP